MPKNPDSHERFGLLLGQIARGWRIEIDRRLLPFGLTESRWLILMHLSRQSAPMTQIELAKLASVKGPTMVRTLDWLESEALIERRLISGDRRAKAVHLTPKATPVLAQIQRVIEGVRQEIFASVAEDDIAICLRTFEHIAGKLGDATPTLNPNKTTDTK